MVVVFDFDGVVNKSDYFSVNYEKDYGVAEQEISIFFRLEFDKCAKGEVDIKTLLPPYLQKWKWKKNLDSFLNYWFTNDISLDYDLINFIKEIKEDGKYVVLASQQEIYRKKYIWEKLELEKIFDEFYCTCDIGSLKSDKEFYTFILRDLKHQKRIKSPKEVIFFDDSENFVKTALETEIEAYLVKNNSEIFERYKNWVQQLPIKIDSNS